jgi:hypothetical protein
MSKRVFITATSLLLYAPLVLFAADPMDRLASAIQAKDWSKGMRVCNGIPGTESRRPDRKQLAGSHFAELAAHCAAAASGAGDRWRSNWWWSTASALDVDTARSLLPRFQSQGLLLDLLPPRMHAYAESPESRPKDQVRLPNGEFVTGKRVHPRNYPRIPDYLSRDVPGVARAQVEVGFIVDEEGILWQPVIVSAQALPVHAFLALCFVGEWRFFPAVVDGAPVASAYSMTVKVETF